MLKDQKIHKRIRIGNEKAQAVVDYINHRYGTGLVPCDLHEDIKLKLDYRQIRTDEDGVETERTFQVKVRDRRIDIIHETHKFKQTNNDSGSKFRVEPGRDAVCKADLYICKPHVYPEKIDITMTDAVKKLSNEAHEAWGVTEFTDELISEWWRRARLHDNNMTHLFTDSQGTEICFKIDEGSDTQPYGKLLSFIKSSALHKREDCYIMTIEFAEGEELSRPETWKTWRKNDESSS